MAARKKTGEWVRHVGDFIVLDFETTGLDPARERIVEACAIRYTAGREQELFTTLVNPQMPIPPSSTAVHHITDRMVAGAPEEETVIRGLLDMMGRLPVFGHNIGFDMRFLRSAAGRYGITVFSESVDTVALARRYWPGLASYRLENVARHLSLFTPSHRAEADCRSCAGIVLAAAEQEYLRSHAT